MAPEMEAASRGAITTKGFELEAQRVAKLMRDKFDIGFLDVGGWDTHVGEGGAEGYLAGRFDKLGRGLAAFATEMGPVWRNTVVVALSEFGRTFRENGNRGPITTTTAFTGCSAAPFAAAVSPASRYSSPRRRCSRTVTTRCSTNTVPSSPASSDECTGSVPRSRARCSPACGHGISGSSKARFGRAASDPSAVRAGWPPGRARAGPPVSPGAEARAGGAPRRC